jgi:hypothetical protein
LENYTNSLSFIENEYFCKKENFTVENIIKIIEFKPLDCFYQEITSFQREYKPLFVQHLYEELLDASVYIKTQIEKQKLNAVKREENTIGLKEISGMDPYNCCISGCRQEDLQRDLVPGSWISL